MGQYIAHQCKKYNHLYYGGKQIQSIRCPYCIIIELENKIKELKTEIKQLKGTQHEQS